MLKLQKILLINQILNQFNKSQNCNINFGLCDAQCCSDMECSEKIKEKWANKNQCRQDKPLTKVKQDWTYTRQKVFAKISSLQSLVQVFDNKKLNNYLTTIAAPSLGQIPNQPLVGVDSNNTSIYKLFKGETNSGGVCDILEGAQFANNSTHICQVNTTCDSSASNFLKASYYQNLKQWSSVASSTEGSFINNQNLSDPTLNNTTCDNVVSSVVQSVVVSATDPTQVSSISMTLATQSVPDSATSLQSYLSIQWMFAVQNSTPTNSNIQYGQVNRDLLRVSTDPSFSTTIPNSLQYLWLGDGSGNCRKTTLTNNTWAQDDFAAVISDQGSMAEFKAMVQAQGSQLVQFKVNQDAVQSCTYQNLDINNLSSSDQQAQCKYNPLQQVQEDFFTNSLNVQSGDSDSNGDPIILPKNNASTDPAEQSETNYLNNCQTAVSLDFQLQRRNESDRQVILGQNVIPLKERLDRDSTEIKLNMQVNWVDVTDQYNKEIIYTKESVGNFKIIQNLMYPYNIQYN